MKKIVLCCCLLFLGSCAVHTEYKRDVRSIYKLVLIDQLVREFAFKVTGYKADLFCFCSVPLRLTELKSEIKINWSEYKKISMAHKVLVQSIDENLKKFYKFIETTKELIGKEKKAEVLEALEDDWPDFHEGVLNKIDKLMKAHYKQSLGKVSGATQK